MAQNQNSLPAKTTQIDNVIQRDQKERIPQQQGAEVKGSQQGEEKKPPRKPFVCVDF
jgi:hypothetical protein